MRSWLALAGALALTVTPLWRLLGTHLDTVAHEAGHALVAGLTSGRVDAVRIDPDGGGVTHWTDRTGAGVPVGLAGYPAPSAVGLGALALLHADRVLGALMLMFAALVVMLALVRNPFGIGVVLAAGAILCLSVLYGSAAGQALVVGVLAWTLLIGSVRSALGLFPVRRGDRSDAHALAAVTLIPATLWAGLFVLLTTAAAAYAGWLTLHGW